MLADAFNESLLTPTKLSSSTINTESPNLTSEPDTELTPNNSKQPIFYESDEWEKFVARVLANITVPQPSNLRTQGQQQECQQQPPQQPQCQDQEGHHPAQQVNQNINITSVNIAGSKFLFLSTVCFTDYNEWQKGLKRLHFHCVILGKKLSSQHRTPTSSNTNFASMGCSYDVLHHSGKCQT